MATRRRKKRERKSNEEWSLPYRILQKTKGIEAITRIRGKREAIHSSNKLGRKSGTIERTNMNAKERKAKEYTRKK